MEAIIIDDERLAREELRNLLKKHEDVLTIVAEAQNGKEGIKLIEKHNPDLLFLDIQMPELDGFEMLRKLDEIPHCIFVSAYDEYALQAFKVNALDYLLKPINPDQLAQSIQKVRHEIEAEDDFLYSIENSRENRKLGIQDRVFIKEGEKCFFPKLQDVVYFESVGNYVRVYFKTERPMILRSLNALEKHLSEEDFFRGNRKYILNIHYIDKIENWFNGGLKISLVGGKEIEVSRRQAIRFKEFMSL